MNRIVFIDDEVRDILSQVKTTVEAALHEQNSAKNEETGAE